LFGCLTVIYRDKEVVGVFVRFRAPLQLYLLLSCHCRIGGRAGVVRENIAVCDRVARVVGSCRPGTSP
jgi:hypothetical protein